MKGATHMVKWLAQVVKFRAVSSLIICSSASLRAQETSWLLFAVVSWFFRVTLFPHLMIDSAQK